MCQKFIQNVNLIFTVISIDSLLVYQNKYYLHLDNCAYEIIDKRMTDLQLELPLLKEERGGGGRTFQKLSYLGGGYKMFCQKGGIKLKRGGVVDVEMGGCHFLYYFTVQFNHIYCVQGKSKVPFISFGSSVFCINHARLSSKSYIRFSFTFSSKSCSKTWYHL